MLLIFQFSLCRFQSSSTMAALSRFFPIVAILKMPIDSKASSWFSTLYKRVPDIVIPPSNRSPLERRQVVVVLAFLHALTYRQPPPHTTPAPPPPCSILAECLVRKIVSWLVDRHRHALPAAEGHQPPRCRRRGHHRNHLCRSAARAVVTREIPAPRGAGEREPPPAASRARRFVRFQGGPARTGPPPPNRIRCAKSFGGVAASCDRG